MLSLVPITDGVLAAAEAIEPHLKTLDAIHLGSVIAAGLDATIVTHDPRHGRRGRRDRLSDARPGH